ncbi:MAG TPA: Gfo/Idh/MocA family oxidoreductase, partial [Chitinophagaceae bacterium]|nr:Gfo/Idh/MocA family oxidoreductase [Chitinophagaceae bacterium]
FIEKAALLTGSMLLQQQMMKAFAMNKTGKKIQLGVIGCGQRGQGILHILTDLTDSFTVTALCDTLDFRFDESKKAGKLNAVKTYKDYKQLLDDKQVEAVIIAVPLYLHFPIAKAAFEAGKHIYLEKTMTYSIPQVLDLVSIARQHSRQILQVGHQYRYSPLYYKVRDMIDKGYLGKVTSIDCRWDRNGNWRRPLPDPSLEKQINWRMYKAFSGGLAAELLSHQLDYIHWVFKTRPDSLYATGGIDFWKDGRETSDNIQATLRYEKEGMIGNFGATCSNSRQGYLFDLKGSKGTISLLVDQGVYYPEAEQKKQLQTVDGVTGATKLEWNKEGGIPIVTGPMKDGTWYALNDFYTCVTTGRQPASNVLTGATTALAVHLINQSADTHLPQQWSPDYNLSGV